MPEVCPNCGAYALRNKERSLDHLTCLHCGQPTSTNIYPLFIVTGTSGAGKTTVASELIKALPECVVFDKDLLLSTCTASWENFYTSWLLLAHSIAQGGRHTVICGTILPQDLDQCEARELVSTIHFLNLHCSDAERAKRLRTRPSWRGVSEAFIEEHKRFAQWLLDNASTSFDPPMPTLDTSTLSVEEVAQRIAEWVRRAIETY